MIPLVILLAPDTSAGFGIHVWDLSLVITSAPPTATVVLAVWGGISHLSCTDLILRWKWGDRELHPKSLTPFQPLAPAGVFGFVSL